MRNSLHLIISIVSFLLIGCDTAYVEKYIYKNVEVDSVVTVEKTHWNEVIYKRGEYEFFPRFYTLSKSYSNPGALLIISSSTRSDIFLESVVLESENQKHRDVVDFNREVLLDRYNEDDELNYVALPVFGIDTTDLAKYWDSGDIRVMVNYRDGKDQVSLVFWFELWKGREVVWPT